MLTRNKFPPHDNEEFRRGAKGGDDYFCVFHELMLEYGFSNFAIVNLSNKYDLKGFFERLVLHNIPTRFSERYDRLYCFSESEIFKGFYEVTVPVVWPDGLLSRAGNVCQSDPLRQIGASSALVVPVHSATGIRYVVLFLGGRAKLDDVALAEIFYETSFAFDRFHRQVLTEKRGKPLTSRETEVLRWISYGKTASEIAQIISISEHTVNSHTAAILKKLDVVNRTQMVAKALRERLIQ